MDTGDIPFSTQNGTQPFFEAFIGYYKYYESQYKGSREE